MFSFLHSIVLTGVQSSTSLTTTATERVLNGVSHALLRPRVVDVAVRDTADAEGRAFMADEIDSDSGNTEVGSTGVDPSLHEEETGEGHLSRESFSEVESTDERTVENGLDGGLGFTSTTEMRRLEGWRPERLGLLLEIFSTYTRGLRVLQLLSDEVLKELSKWETRLEAREEELGEVEIRRQLERDFAAWQTQLGEREAELLAREEEFESISVSRIRAHLTQMEDWEAQARTAIRAASE